MKKGEEEDKEKLESVKDAGKKEKTSKKKSWLARARCNIQNVVGDEENSRNGRSCHDQF